MAKQLQLRRGTTAELDAFTGAEGEVVVNTDDFSLRVHDGVTQGGHKIALASLLTSLQQTLESTVSTKIGTSKGSATKGVYVDSSGNLTACTYELNKTVPADAKFTDTNTVTTVTTTGSGNCVSAISASNGALTVTKGVTALTSISGYVKTNNGSLAVGSYAIASVYTKSAQVSNGSTTAGSNLRVWGMQNDGGSDYIYKYATPTGTWRNVSGVTLGNASGISGQCAAIGLWQRTA